MTAKQTATQRVKATDKEFENKGAPITDDMSTGPKVAPVELIKTYSLLSVGDIDAPENPIRPVNVNDQDFKELVESIRAKGVLVPIVVTQTTEGRYSLIAGNRRTTAVRTIFGDRGSIPSVVIDAKSALDQVVIAGVENFQRSEMNQIEIINYIKALKKLGKNGKEIARLLNKSQAWVSTYSQGTTFKAKHEAQKAKQSEAERSTEERYHCPHCEGPVVRMWDSEAGKYVLRVDEERHAKEQSIKAKVKAEKEAA